METRREERIGQLLQELKRSDKLHLKDAAALLGVSEMTIRRDLNNHSAPVVLLGGYIVLEPRSASHYLKASYTLTEPQLTAPLKKGQVVGTIDFQLNGKSIEQRPLIVMENVEEGGFFGRVWDFVMMKFHQWFGSWFS